LTIKQALFRKDFGVLSSFFFSINFFLRDFNNILKQRKKIQSSRVIKEDIFFKVKIPEFG